MLAFGEISYSLLLRNELNMGLQVILLGQHPILSEQKFTRIRKKLFSEIPGKINRAKDDAKPQYNDKTCDI